MNGGNFRVIEARKAGTLAVRRGELKANTSPGCPELRMPAQVAFYHARACAIGSDHLVYEMTTSTGEVGTYDVTIAIKDVARPGLRSGESRI